MPDEPCRFCDGRRDGVPDNPYPRGTFGHARWDLQCAIEDFEDNLRAAVLRHSYDSWWRRWRDRS